MNNSNKIGLYFGSFNPIHIGHLIIARYVLNETDINQVWFIVSPQNPLKKATSLLNEFHRLHLVRLAIEDDYNLQVNNVEFSLPKPSYTIDTLTYLDEKYPEKRFSVIMGSDSFINIHKWKNREKLLSNYNLIIYERPGFKIPNNETGITLLPNTPLLNISSTEIRKMIASGKSVKYFVPDKVAEEITRGGYYK